MGRLSAFIAAASVSAALLIGGASHASAAVVLADGHVDYGARMIGGALQSQIKDTTQGPSALVWREPSEVLFGLGPAAKMTIPSGSKIGFLGPPGTSLWMIPQVQRAGVIWAGWNTEEINATQVTGGVTWTLDAVEGPGTVAVFETGSFGDPDVIFNSADGLPDSRVIPLGTHAHGNWAFSAAGEYRLTFTMSAERAGGLGPTADTETLAVRVEDEAAPTPAPGVGGSGGSGPESGADSGGRGSGGGQGGGEQTPGKPATARPLVEVPFARAQGRTLTVAVRSDTPGSATITVRQAGRRVAAAGPRRVGPSHRRVHFKLPGQLAPGRYTVGVTVRTARATVTRAVPLRVPTPR